MIGTGLLEPLEAQPPLLPVLTHPLQQLLQLRPAKTIQPAPLQTGPGQLLTLPLHREINQQRP
jgi:hypothetical protein